MKATITNFVLENEGKSPVSIGNSYKNYGNIIASSRLNAAQKKEIEAIIKRFGAKKVFKWVHEEQNKIKAEQQKEKDFELARKIGVSYRQLLAIREKTDEISSTYNRFMGYSMGQITYVSVNGIILSRYDNTDTYGGKYKNKGRETHGSYTLSLTKKEALAIQDIKGVWTIVNPDGSAKWLKTNGLVYSKGAIVWENGFIWKYFHSTDSLAHARLGYYRSEKKEREYKIKEAIESLKKEEQNKRFVGYAHLRNAGACDPGIKGFCSRHGLDINSGYNIGYLRSLNDSSSEYYLKRV